MVSVYTSLTIATQSVYNFPLSPLDLAESGGYFFVRPEWAQQHGGAEINYHRGCIWPAVGPAGPQPHVMCIEQAAHPAFRVRGRI